MFLDTSHGTGYQSEEAFREEIINALKACDVADPYAELDVDAAAKYLFDDQYVNAPDEFWDVVRRFRRQRLKEKQQGADSTQS